MSLTALQHADKNRSTEFLPCKLEVVKEAPVLLTLYSLFLTVPPILPHTPPIPHPLLTLPFSHAADKYRVILSGEIPDYIHAVSVNVSSL